jgi:hypothetical protein
MFAGERELLVTALTDAEFGVMVAVGMGGGMTEIIDDVVFARAPLDAAARRSHRSLATLRRLPATCRRAARARRRLRRPLFRAAAGARGRASRSKSIR